MLNHELRPFLLADRSVTDFLRTEFSADFASAELLKDNLNFVFAAGNLILRFSPASKKKRSEIEAELTWTRFLNDRELNVNEIVPTPSGEVCTELTVAGQLLYLVVFRKCPGDTCKKADWNTAHYAQLGRLAGQLHRSSLEFHDQVDANFPHWHQHSKAAVTATLPRDNRNLPYLLDQLTERFNQLPVGPDAYGVIHYDIHHGNYFLQRGRPGAPLFLFDFEMTCRGWYLQDIAVILYYASNLNTIYQWQERPAFESAFLNAFAETYQPLMPEIVLDPDLIQSHLLYRDLFVYAYVLDAWRGRSLNAGDQRLIDLLEANISGRRAAQGLH